MLRSVRGPPGGAKGTTFRFVPSCARLLCLVLLSFCICAHFLSRSGSFTPRPLPLPAFAFRVKICCMPNTLEKGATLM